MGLIQLFKRIVRVTGIHWTGKLVCFIGLLSLPPALYAGQYFQNFPGFPNGATNFSDGSTLSSTAPGTIAGVTNFNSNGITGTPVYSELQLTEVGDTNVQSAFELPDLDPGTPVYAFSVKWNADIDGTPPALGNGFSFNFGPFSSASLITNDAEEFGYGAGLCLSVRTTEGTNEPLYLLVNGATIATFTNNPAAEWGVKNSTRHFWEVDWNYYSGMSVRLDGQPIFNDVATTNFVPESGDVFAWGARNTTNTEEVRMDNIVAVTGGNLVELPTSGPYFAEGGLGGSDGYSVTNAFDGTNSTYYDCTGAAETAGATISPANPVLVLALTTGQGPTSAPHEWSLEGSTNGGAVWSPCGGGSGYFLNSPETRAWLVTNSLPDYGAYELFFPPAVGSGIDGFSTIGELRFYSLSVVGAPYAAWKAVARPGGDGWTSIASSADGTRLAATTFSVFVSTDSGDTWTKANSVSSSDIASSSDGTRLAAIAASSGSPIETNIGDIFDWDFSCPAENFKSIACSSNSAVLAAAVTNGGIYVSTDWGITWTATASTQNWSYVSVSGDGSTLAATVFGGGIYVSTNQGNTWTATSAPTNHWTGIASSSDGTRLAAAGYGGIYVSTNSGGAWTLTSAPNHNNWMAIASSWDGTRVAASCSTPIPSVYLSTDSGNTWTNSGAPIVDFVSIASSSAGNKLAACYNEGIYTYGYAGPPSPLLKAQFSGGYPVLSWNTTNGGNFVLQETTNLSNWSNVPWPVTTNSSSYQVTDLPTGGLKFYRLVAQ